MARPGIFLVDTFLHDSPGKASSNNSLDDTATRPEFCHILEQFLQRDQYTSSLGNDAGTSIRLGGGM